MSSTAGLSSYSSLFASGLHPSGRLQAAMAAKDVDAVYPFQRSYDDLKDVPSNVNARRPSADTESTQSRHSSLPTFASDRRRGRNNSYYPPNQQQQQQHHPAGSPSTIAFTPSILLRSDTTTTKRSNLQSFLSMDANDYTQQPTVPPLPSSFYNPTSPLRASQNKLLHRRALSVSSSTRAPSMLPSPNTTNFDSDRHSIASPSSRNPSNPAAASVRRSLSAPLRANQNQDNQSAKSSDKPPRLEIELGLQVSRISFDPTAPAIGQMAAFSSGEAAPSTSPIPERPEYVPRVRSSLPSDSTPSPLSSVPPRGVQRNMSVTSASTFTSVTPSQRSAIRRTRRNEALARLEGNHYDPTPEAQASGSFMPFESDEEEEEEEGVNRNTHRDTLSSRAKSPPPIKSPSPLRYRGHEQRRFVEIDPPESLFELALTSIAEAPPTPQLDTRTSLESHAPSVRVHQSMWTSFEEQEEENVAPSALSHQQYNPPMTTSRTPVTTSPLSSPTNLTAHTTNRSSTSLTSFTPFSSTDFNRMRTGSVYNNVHVADSPYATLVGSKPSSGPESNNTRHSVSIRNSDIVSSDESLDLGIRQMVRNMDPHVSRRDQEHSRDRSGFPAPPAHYLKATSAAALDASLDDVPRGGGRWMQGHSSSVVTPTAPKAHKSSKHRENDVAHTKAKEAKMKEGKIRYETYLDMSGDERPARDGGLKKRRWLFGK